jgi:hypothetical protein
MPRATTSSGLPARSWSSDGDSRPARWREPGGGEVRRVSGALEKTRYDAGQGAALAAGDPEAPGDADGVGLGDGVG